MVWFLLRWATVVAAAASCGVHALNGVLSDSPEQIKLSLATGNAANGRIKVMWVTKTCRYHAEQSVRYGLSVSELINQGIAHETVADTTDGWDGCIVYEEMAGLRPNTTYYYMVHGGTFTKSSATYRFTTPAPTSVKFAVISDLGSWDWAVKTATAISADTTLNAVLSGGDLDYADGNKGKANCINRDIFGRVWQPVFAQSLFQSAIGDHEALNNGNGTGTSFVARYSQHYGQATASRRWWSIDFGPVHAIFVDTVFAGSTQNDWPALWKRRASEIATWHANMKSEMLRFISSDLAAVNRTKTPWVVAIQHVSPYSSGQHVPKPGPNDANREVRNTLEPLYVAGKVDFVFSGHEHGYERTYPVKDFTVMGTFAKNYFYRPTHPINIVTGATGIPKAPTTYGPHPAWVAYRLMHNTRNPGDGQGVGWLRAEFTQSNAFFIFYRTMDGKIMDSFIVKK
eukprot:comp19904_c0_seq1/m.24131 comp19904_c0_seq1/g.24131  ORF comp19904_c0_seq1/g.24131 comp19904_c0_seq1/m.24131 type:complete len:456 (-) comp19904_c0_seq1:465-1832(-)